MAAYLHLKSTMDIMLEHYKLQKKEKTIKSTGKT